MEDMKKALADLEKEVTCAVCLEHFCEPKALPCLHYYCKKCILNMALKKNPITCPECRKETKIIPGEEDNLPTAHFVYRLKDLHCRQEKAMSKEIQCEICTGSEVKAVAFCKQCKKFICSRCKESHSVMRAIFEGHEVISISAVKELNVEEYTANSPVTMCDVHDEPLKLHCSKCKKMICMGCTVTDHKDHNLGFINEVATEKKDFLLKMIKPLSEMERDMEKTIREVKSTMEELDAEKERLGADIKASFDELRTILTSHENRLLEELKERVEQKRTNLNMQEKTLSTAIAQVHGVLHYTRHCIQHCSDYEILNEHDHVAMVIERGLADHKELVKNLCCVEELDMALLLNCAKGLQRFLEANAQLVRKPLTVQVESCTDFIVYCPYELYVIVTSSRGDRVDLDLNVLTRIKLPDGTLLGGKGRRVEAGKYSVRYIPNEAGHHDFFIVVKEGGRLDSEVSHSNVARETLPPMFFYRR